MDSPDAGEGEAAPSEASAAAGALVRALSDGGEYVADGRFTIDNESRESLARYQLAEARSWPPFLVEVAVLLGAATIHFRFSGWVIEAELELPGADPRLVESLERFGAGQGRRDPAKLLGLVFRAACRGEPERLTLEAVDAQGQGQRCTWSSGSYAQREAISGAPGLRLWLRQPIEHGDAGEVERARLVSCCRPSRFAVFADGNQISVGPVGAFAQFGASQVNARVPIMRGGHEIGTAGLHERPGAGRILLMQNQVVVESLGLPKELQGLGGAFTALVELDQERDLSLTRFVRDADFEATMEAVRASYLAVAERSRHSALALREALSPIEEPKVDALAHAADHDELRRGSGLVRVGGASISLALLLWVAMAFGVAVPSVVPLIALGAGLLLVFRELG